VAERRGERQVLRRELAAGGEHGLAARHVHARIAHVFARDRGPPHLTALAVACPRAGRVLERHDRVGALGQHRPGHDARRLAGGERARRGAPGGQHLDDAERDRVSLARRGQVGAPDGEAVHRGVPERRQRVIGHERLAERAPGAVLERRPLGRQGPDRRQHALARRA
jgi:hypothetical protein